MTLPIRLKDKIVCKCVGILKKADKLLKQADKSSKEADKYLKKADKSSIQAEINFHWVVQKDFYKNYIAAFVRICRNNRVKEGISEFYGAFSKKESIVSSIYWVKTYFYAKTGPKISLTIVFIYEKVLTMWCAPQFMIQEGEDREHVQNQ